MSRHSVPQPAHEYALSDEQLVPDGAGYLVLSREVGEDIVIEVGGERILVRLIRIGIDKSRLGIKASRDNVKIHRREVWDRINHNEQAQWEKFLGLRGAGQ